MSNFLSAPHLAKKFITQQLLQECGIGTAEELVQVVPEKAVILNPFAGSGTTCLAAKRHHRQYIGFEKTKVYYDIAKKRIEA